MSLAPPPSAFAPTPPGDRERREALVLHHRDYARALALELAADLPRTIEREDLVGAAMLGLTEAARDFDPSRGAAFTTWAWYAVRRHVLDAIRRLTWLPPAVRRDFASRRRMDAANEARFMHGPAPSSPDDPADAARTFAEGVRRLGVVHLLGDLPSESSADVDAVGDVDPANVCADDELRSRLREALAGLDPELRRVVELLYVRGCSTTECADALGLHKGSVTRRHARALEALRTALSVPSDEAPDGRR